MLGTSASSESLQGAVRSAYETSPILVQRRSLQRALDESYLQARAGWRPTVGVAATLTQNSQFFGGSEGQQLVSDGRGNLAIVTNGGSFDYNSTGATLQVSQSLYSGGRIRAAVDAAEADVLAGRAALADVEQQLVLNAIRAYADVQRDQKLILVRQGGVDSLNHQVEEVSAKAELGQANLVDVAQSRAQLFSARAQLAAAVGQLGVSAAEYIAVVGSSPSRLEEVERLDGVPAGVETAFDIAGRENPLLAQAGFTEQASRFRIAEARSAGHPSVNAQFSVGNLGQAVPFAPRDFNKSLLGGVTFSQPIYAGGQIRSSIRQATQRNLADRSGTDVIRRAVIQNVSQS